MKVYSCGFKDGVLVIEPGFKVPRGSKIVVDKDIFIPIFGAKVGEILTEVTLLVSPLAKTSEAFQQVRYHIREDFAFALQKISFQEHSDSVLLIYNFRNRKCYLNTKRSEPVPNMGQGNIANCLISSGKKCSFMVLVANENTRINVDKTFENLKEWVIQETQ